MSRYYDRQGNPITLMDVAKVQKRVAETTLPDGKWVSTVWLGIDHRFDTNGPPLIFETMVFPKYGEWGELDCERYSTEEEARSGHETMMAKWSKPEVTRG